VLGKLHSPLYISNRFSHILRESFMVSRTYYFNFPFESHLYDHALQPCIDCLMNWFSVPANSGSSCARRRKRASQEAKIRLSERFFPPNRLGKIVPAIAHHADRPTTMRFDRDGVESMPPDPHPQTAPPRQSHPCRSITTQENCPLTSHTATRCLNLVKASLGRLLT
jgi:hypothetical protein